MLPMISDAQFNSIALVVVAIVSIIPTTLAAVWARNAKSNSEQAKSNSADALHEVKANGGMSDPDPTLKDYIKYVGETVTSNTDRISAIEELLGEHIAHSRIMDSALAQVYLHVKPNLDKTDVDELQEKLF